MDANTSNSQKNSFDTSDTGSTQEIFEYPKTTAGVIRRMQKDLEKDYRFFIKDKNVKEIKITKIDKKKGIMYLWIHKKDRIQIPQILSLLTKYPFKYMLFPEESAPEYLLKCTVEINPTNIPKGIILLN